MILLLLFFGCGPSTPTPPPGPVQWQLGGPQQAGRYAPADAHPAVAVSPSGNRVATRSAQGTVHVVDAQRGRTLIEIPPSQPCESKDCPLTSVAFVDEDQLVVLYHGQAVQAWYALWDVSSRRQVHSALVSDLREVPFDGRPWQIALDAAWTRTRMPLRLDVVDGHRFTHAFPDPKDPPYKSALSPDGEYLAWADTEGYLRLTDPLTQAEIAYVQVTPMPIVRIQDLRWSPSGDRIIVVADHDGVLVYDLALQRLAAHKIGAIPEDLLVIDNERALVWSSKGLSCVDLTTCMPAGDVWGAAVGEAAMASHGDTAWLDIAGAGLIRVDVPAFCAPIP